MFCCANISTKITGVIFVHPAHITVSNKCSESFCVNHSCYKRLWRFFYFSIVLLYNKINTRKGYDGLSTNCVIKGCINVTCSDSGNWITLFTINLVVMNTRINKTNKHNKTNTIKSYIYRNIMVNHISECVYKLNYQLPWHSIKLYFSKILDRIILNKYCDKLLTCSPIFWLSSEPKCIKRGQYIGRSLALYEF